MYAWIQRKKKQAWGIAIAATAGAAVAYCAYSWYMKPEGSGEVENSDQDQTGANYQSPNSVAYTEQSRESAKNPHSSTTASLDLEARIREQQALLQSIANQQTLPDAHQRLHQCLLEYSGVDRLTAGLRALRPSAPPATSSTPSAFPATSAEHAERMARKLSMWAELRDQSFVLLTATTWLLPALTLLVHVQLTIIGRSAYLEHLAHAPSGAAINTQHLGQRSNLGSPMLTGVAVKRLRTVEQEAFLSCGSFLLKSGLVYLLPALQDTVKRHVGDLALQERVSLSSLWQILSQVHEEVDSTVHADAWRAALLPPLVAQTTVGPVQERPGTQSDDMPPQSTDAGHTPGAGQSSYGRNGHMEPVEWVVASEYQPAGLDAEGASVVAKLILEAQEILASDFFMQAFHTSVKWCAAATAEALHDHFDNVPRPSVLASASDTAGGLHSLGAGAQQSSHAISQAEEASMVTAAILPRLAKVADELLTSSHVSEEMCQLPAVRALLDATFASGPFLGMHGPDR